MPQTGDVMLAPDLLAQLAAAGRHIVAQGWAVGRGGNLSGRLGGVIWITIRGAALDQLDAAAFAPVTLVSGEAQGSARPSSELLMHLAAYRTDAAIQAVVHIHPPHAIACGAVGLEAPALTPDFAIHVGERAPLVSYLRPGSSALAEAVETALRQAPGVLLQNHGVLAVGRSVEEALLRAALIEETAQIVLLAHAVARPVRTLSRGERAELLAMRYGRGESAPG